MNELIKSIYYDPETGAFSADNTYRLLKDKGVKKKDVIEFVKNQAVSQIHKKYKEPHFFYPITASHENNVWQLDLADMTNLSTFNKNYKWLFMCVDVFTRKGYVEPMKTKGIHEVVSAMETILKKVKPEHIMCDKGSEYISKQFKTLCNKNNIIIHYVEVKDYNRLGIVNRYIQTLRTRIERYLTAYNTHNYIDVLQKLVNSINNSYNSGIKQIPNKVNANEVKQLFKERIEKAKKYEVEYKDGDTVRSVLKKTLFQKGSLPKWSAETTKTKSKAGVHSYKIEGQKKPYKYYELQLAKKEEELNIPKQSITRQNIMQDNRRKRILKQSGINPALQVNTKRKKEVSKRLLALKS